MDWSLLLSDCSYKKPFEKGKTLEMESKVGVDWGWEQELVPKGRRELSEGVEVCSAGLVVVMVAQHNRMYARKATALYANNGIEPKSRARSSSCLPKAWPGPLPASHPSLTRRSCTGLLSVPSSIAGVSHRRAFALAGPFTWGSLLPRRGGV